MTDSLNVSNNAISAIIRKIDSLIKAGDLATTEVNALLKNLSKVKRSVYFTSLLPEEETSNSQTQRIEPSHHFKENTT